jgi:4-hydroxybenzoate polyprenyltransferase
LHSLGFFLAYFQNFWVQKGWNLHELAGVGINDTDLFGGDLGCSKFLLVLLCMIFARSAAMAFNRYLDRRWDALNPRTAIREIPKGIITPKNAFTFTVLFVPCCLLPVRFLSIPSAFTCRRWRLAVVLGYSYTKRFTPLCHLVLGLGLALAPIGAYLAVTGQVSVIACAVFVCRVVLGKRV